MNPFEIFKKAVFKTAKTNGEPILLIDGLVLAGGICNLILFVISLICCLCTPATNEAKIITDTIAPITLKTSIAFIIFGALYIVYSGKVYHDNTDVYDKLSGDAYETLVLTSVYAFLAIILSPTSYIYFTVIYAFKLIAVICDLIIIQIPSMIIHLVCGNHKPVEKTKKDDTSLLSDYNKLLSK
jgi:hypothetical protein